MKKLSGKLWAKLAAVFLLTVFAVTAAASGVGVGFLFCDNAYIDSGTSLYEEVMQSVVYEEISHLANKFEISVQNADFSFPMDDYSPQRSNFRFVLTPEDGSRITNISESETIRFSCEDSYQIFTSAGKAEMIHITGAISEELIAADSIRRTDLWVNKLISLRYWLIAMCLISFAAAVVCFIFLLCAAGHKEGVEGIYLNWFNRLPFDIVLLLIGVCINGILYMVRVNLNGGFESVLALLTGCPAIFWLFLLLVCSFAAQNKADRLIKGSALYHLTHLLFRFCRWLWRTLSLPLKHIRECWKPMVLFLALSLIGLLFCFATDYDSFGALWMIERPLFLILLAYLTLSFRKIEKGGQELADGNLSYQIKSDPLTLPPFRSHAENLNHIGEGMEKAVSEQMKSERMKTELITNVSHDIKTPLTSIVNYVGLLKSLDIQDETAQEYIDILDRQSARLKKLTEDLVEASKASTGNLVVVRTATDVNVLLSQIAGEYEEKLDQLGLQLIVTAPEEEVSILADGKLLSRVFDNLMSNVCKYAMPGTRVYLGCQADDAVTISVKNISKYALNIPGSELMERFVRGDTSRSTEGSGLGLSIAKSLTELQGGSFAISIDGDLFRADLTFPIHKE